MWDLILMAHMGSKWQEHEGLMALFALSFFCLTSLY